MTGILWKSVPAWCSILTTGSITNYSGFFEDDITLIDRRLTLDAGQQRHSAPISRAPNWNLAVRLMWTPAEKHAFWAAFTHAIRAPSQGEHDFYLSSYLGSAGGVPIFGRYDANPDFAPEQLNGYEIGYRALIGKKFFIDFAGFENHYHDLFSEDLTTFEAPSNTLPFPGPPPPNYILIAAQFRNDFYGTTAGGEIAPEFRPTDRWRLRGSYSYLNMNLSKVPGTPPGNTPQSEEESSPRHQVTVQSSFDITKKLQLDLIYRYVGALPALGVPAVLHGRRPVCVALSSAPGVFGGRQQLTSAVSCGVCRRSRTPGRHYT